MQFTRRSVARIVALGAVLALALSACGGSDKKSGVGDQRSATTVAGKKGGAITIAAEQEISNWNTNTSADNCQWCTEVARLVYPQMYVQTPQITYVPGLIADGPATIVKQSPFTVRWKIKQDAVWSDGVPVSSDDLEYYYLSCNDKVDPGEPVDPEDPTATGRDCVDTTGYDQITKFTKVDQKTAEAVFSGPIAEYPSLFSNPMPPAHIAKTKGKDAWENAFVTNPGASAGPYKLKDYKKGESLTLERNDTFTIAPPNIDTITIRFIKKDTAQLDALRNGEVDLIYPKPQTDSAEQIRDIPGVHYEFNIGPQWEHLTFNLRNAILADPKVRAAISTGIDRQDLVDRLIKPFNDKATTLGNRIYMNDTPEYVDQSIPFNLEGAKQLLEGDGWTAGADGIRTKNGKRLSLRIITTGGDTLREKTEEILQDHFKAMGIDLKIANLPSNDAFDPIFGGKDTANQWDIALFAWVGTATPGLSSKAVYATDSGNNAGNYANKTVDSDFDKAIAELDATKRKDLLNAIDKTLWGPNELPDLPLYQKPTFLAYADKFANIIDNTTSEGFTWNAEQWSLK